MSDNAELRGLSASEVACYRWPDDTDKHKALRQAFIEGAMLSPLNVELLVACKVMMAQLEDALADATNDFGQTWVPGKTDLQLRPDGSYLLSDVRAVIAKAEAH